MALSQAEFGRAVEGLEGAWREVLGDEPGVCSNEEVEWESVELRTDEMVCNNMTDCCEALGLDLRCA